MYLCKLCVLAYKSQAAEKNKKVSGRLFDTFKNQPPILILNILKRVIKYSALQIADYRGTLCIPKVYRYSIWIGKYHCDRCVVRPS